MNRPIRVCSDCGDELTPDNTHYDDYICDACYEEKFEVDEDSS